MATYADTCTALAVALEAGTPTLLWGGAGEGKTTVIEQFARDRGKHLETVIASISDPTDFQGMPYHADGKTMFSPPDWAQAIADADVDGIVFFDEISTAPPSVQAALLRPILGKVVGSLALPEQTRFIAAANPPEIAADGWDLSAPLANRFVHIDWDLPAEVGSHGFTFGFEDITVPVIDTDAAAALVVEMKMRVGAFLNARPDMKSVIPKDSPGAGRAWPRPRSWESGARLLAYGRAGKVSQGTLNVLMMGAVGPSAAREYLTWESNLDLPDVEAAIKAKGAITLPGTADKIMVVCGATAAAIKGNATKARCDAAVNGILVAIAAAGYRDLAVVALKQVAQDFQKSGAVLSPAAVEHFGAILAEMGKIAKGTTA